MHYLQTAMLTVIMLKLLNPETDSWVAVLAGVIAWIVQMVVAYEMGDKK